MKILKFCLDCKSPKSKKGLYCKGCGYKHRYRPSGLVYKLHKINPTSFHIGYIPWNKGLPSSFKKDNPGYDALHEWVERWLGKPNKCEKCGNNRYMEWANKSGKYLRQINDWMRLCKRCHHRYDFEHFGARKTFYTGGNPLYG